MDKCYTLKICAEKAKGASSSGLTKKSFPKEINILAKRRPREKILEHFAIVFEQEHEKLAAKTPKKAKKTKLILDESTSDTSEEDVSVDHMSISKRTTMIVPPKY
jgi:hypothetical protein